MTVEGPVDPGLLGVTLIHEHLHTDFTPIMAAHGYTFASDDPLNLQNAADARWNPGGFPDNYRLTDINLISDEVRRFARLGGGTVVDVTPIGMGRDPTALRTIGRRAGVHVIMGTGTYLEPAVPPQLAEMSADELARLIIDEHLHGVDGMGVRPGVIGEIGTGDPMTPMEERGLRAAARAQRATGLPLSVHLHPWGYEGTRVLDVLSSEAVPPERVVLDHVSTSIDSLDYLRELIAAGVYLGFDLFGFDHSLLGLGRYPPSDADVTDVVAALVAEGLARQLLLSQDVGVKTRLRAFGGWGYTHLLEHVLPLLLARGVDDSAIEAMLVGNPKRLLAVEGRGPATGGEP